MNKATKAPALYIKITSGYTPKGGIKIAILGALI
jgi:hypothetical protein